MIRVYSIVEWYDGRNSAERDTDASRWMEVGNFLAECCSRDIEDG